MCIIVYKPAGIENPSWATLHKCFDYNPDGAGFMYAEGGKVHINKGFMSWNGFKKAFKPFKNRQDLPIVCHFRITTHGGTEKGLCHPFPLSSNTEELKATESETEIGIAHNGCISLTSYAGKGMSDTSEFVRKYANIIVTSPQWYRNPNANKLLSEVIGSKMLVLSNDGHGEVVGNGWTEDNGVMYSNKTYMSYGNWWKSSLSTTTTKESKSNKHTNVYDDGYLSGWDYGYDYDDGTYKPTYCKYWYTDTGEATAPSEACKGCCEYRYCWE